MSTRDTFVRALALGAFFALGACADPQTPRSPTTHRPTLDVESVLASVVRVRGLSPIGEVDVEKLDDRAFAAKKRELEIEPDNIVLLDLAHRALYVRRKRESDPNARVELVQFFDALLLEDHFKVASEMKVGSIESNQSRLGLIFADEQLTWAGVEAESAGAPISRAIALAGATPANLARAEGATAVEHMQTISRELAREFLGALYRTGGFRLVDRVMAHPPETRAFYDAQTWLDGLARTSFVPPPLTPPNGNQVLVSEASAVFVTAIAIESGADLGTARSLGAALRYGRFEFIREGDDANPARLITIFGDAESATTFRKLIVVKDAPEGGGGAHDPSADALPKSGSLVGWHGDLVIATWSPDHALSSKRIDDVVKIAHGATTLDAKPFGALRVAAKLVRPDELLVSTLRGHGYSVPALGLTFEAPFTYQPRPLKGHILADFLAEGSGTLTVGAYAGWDPEDSLHDFLNGATKNGAVVRTLDVPAGGRVPAPWRRTDMALQRARATLLLRPICERHATLLVAAWVFDQGTDATSGLGWLVDWATKLELSNIDESEYCKAITESRTELEFDE